MTRRTLRFSACALACGIVAFGRDARADEGFAVNRFDPAERGSDWFSTESLDLRGSMRPAFGATLDYAYRPLAIYDTNQNLRSAIVRHQLNAHAGASLIFADRLRLGVSVPVSLYSEGEGGTLRGVRYDPADGTTLGDVRLGGDVRLFGEYGDVATMALGVRVFLPTGSPGHFTGDGTVRVLPQAAVAGDVSILAYAARMGVLLRDDSNFAGAPVSHELSFAASVGLRLADKKLLIGPEIFGGTVFDDPFKTRTTPLDGILGVHYAITDSFRIGGGGGLGLTRGYGSPIARGLLSLEYLAPAEAAPKDRDKDGVLDDVDACPDVYGVRSDDPKKNGCPAPKDRDKDGIVDELDACPDEKGVASDVPAKNGCPADSDNDGIPDEVDACPTVPGIRSDDPKKNGCPLDTDGDGIVDADDACPTVPGIKTSDPKTNGCPDPDVDKDGIPNEQDACPDQPGSPDPDPKKNGCPKAFVQGGQIRIIDQVKFKTNSTDIDAGNESEDVLQAVLKVLSDHPEIKAVRVEGHTDNRGAAALNKKLSEGRAGSVVKWLVAHGVDKSRLTAQGFGPDRPIDSNQTDVGRKNNRRVEFHIVEEPKP